MERNLCFNNSSVIVEVNDKDEFFCSEEINNKCPYIEVRKTSDFKNICALIKKCLYCREDTSTGLILLMRTPECLLADQKIDFNLKKHRKILTVLLGYYGYNCNVTL